MKITPGVWQLVLFFAGAVSAVLGMDMDARDWSWDVATRVALPVGLMLVLFIGGTAAFVTTRRAAPLPKPVLRRLWHPLVALVFLMAAGAAAHRDVLKALLLSWGVRSEEVADVLEKWLVKEEPPSGERASAARE